MTNAQGPDAASWPAAPPGPPVPRRRRSRWLTIGLPVAVLVLAAVGVAVWSAVGAVRGAVGPAQDAAEEFADAVVDGRWDDAQGQLCVRDRSTVTADALAQQYALTGLTGYRVDGISVVTSNGETSGEAQVVFTTDTGLDSTTLLPLEEDDGTWRPCP